MLKPPNLRTVGDKRAGPCEDRGRESHCSESDLSNIVSREKAAAKKRREAVWGGFGVAPGVLPQDRTGVLLSVPFSSVGSPGSPVIDLPLEMLV